MQATVRGFVRSYNERFGATVLLTSHYMDDVAALCPRVLVIDHGHLIYDGSLDELVRRVRPDKRVLLKLSRPGGGARSDEDRRNRLAHRRAGGAAGLAVRAAERGSARPRPAPHRRPDRRGSALEEVMRELFERGVAEGAA